MHKLYSYGQYPLAFLNSLIITYALGIYTAEHFNLPYKYLFLLLIVNFLLTLYLAMQKSLYTFLTTLILFFTLGLLRSNTALLIEANNISYYDNQTISLEGIVCEAPTFRKDSQGIYHATYIVEAKKILHNNENKASLVSGKIYLYKKYQNQNDFSSANSVNVNDTIVVSGKLRLINGYHNPATINSELMAKEQGIYAFISANKSDIKIIASYNSFSLKRLASNIREYILQFLLKIIPEEDGYLIFAMIFGGYNNINAEILESFTITGIVHILSVSGSHISLLTGFILNTGKALRFSRRLNLIILVLFIFFYAILCGATPPVIRASIMGLLSATTLCLNKNYEACHLLSITALIMLLISPLLLFNISFQLSFTSTMGLVFIMPYLKEKFSFLPRFIADNISLTLSAQLATIPLIAWYFNSLSLSSIWANLFAIPCLETVIITGLVGSLSSFVVPFISQYIFIFSVLILNFATELTMLFAKLPFANIYLPTIPFFMIIIYYGFLFTLIQKLKIYKYLLILWWFILSFICIYQYFMPNQLQVHFIDVGQGDSAIIITPHKKAVMIDTGGVVNSDFDIGSRVDIPYLKHYGITKLDYLILSHADADHAKGARAILDKIPVNHLIISNEKLDNYAKVLNLNAGDTILTKAIVATANSEFILDEVHFKFLHANLKENLTSSNEASNVLKLSYHHFSALFTGDLPTSGEEILLQNLPPEILHSTILKVAHHGSKTSSSEEFLQAVNPQFAVISVGKYNNFNHPNEEVLTRLENINAQIFRTDEQGAIVFSTDGNKISIHTFK